MATLEADPALRYAGIDAHANVDPEDVIVSLAIRGKGACEIRIPKSRYDAFRLMEAIERHTGTRDAAMTEATPMLSVLIACTVRSAPETRTSAAGKPYTRFRVVREG